MRVPGRSEPVEKEEKEMQGTPIYDELVGPLDEDPLGQVVHMADRIREASERVNSDDDEAVES